MTIQALTETVQRAAAWVRPLESEVARVIVGQHGLVERLLVGLLGDGHILLEGVPGLAKTLSLKTLARRHRGTLPAHPVHPGPAARPTSSAR